jgi:2-C-methyl-D-erythritol 4-phosphate cytidylyltransferase
MYSAIILGGGTGERLGLGYNKVLFKIKGKTIIEHAVQKFLDDVDFTEIIVVMNRNDYDQTKVLFSQDHVRVIKGGQSRQESVALGLEEIHLNPYVFIHDGARPNPSKESIDALKTHVKKYAVTLFTRAKDSIVYMSHSEIESYLEREKVGLIKTPQAFTLSEIKDAYQKANANQREYKDDASLYMNELNKDVILVEDDDANIKLTTQFDLRLLEELL